MGAHDEVKSEKCGYEVKEVSNEKSIYRRFG